MRDPLVRLEMNIVRPLPEIRHHRTVTFVGRMAMAGDYMENRRAEVIVEENDEENR